MDIDKEKLRKMVLEGIDKVKDFNITIRPKAYHKTQIYNLEKLYYELMGINKYLFNPEHEYYYKEYKTMIMFYKGNTKAKMDNQLRRCKRYLLQQLDEILRNCC